MNDHNIKAMIREYAQYLAKALSNRRFSVMFVISMGNNQAFKMGKEKVFYSLKSSV